MTSFFTEAGSESSRVIDGNFWDLLSREALPQPVMLPVFGRKLSTYQLARDYTVESMGFRFTVPAGLITDGASVPWFAWSFGFLPDGLHRAGALVHDWLYALQGQGYDWLFSRKECDDIFHDLMLRAGVAAQRARIMWLAVRACGWWPWRNATGPELRPRGIPPRPPAAGADGEPHDAGALRSDPGAEHEVVENVVALLARKEPVVSLSLECIEPVMH